MPVLVGKSVSADILKSISDFDINRSPEFVIGYYCVKIFGNIGRFSFELGIVPCGFLCLLIGCCRLCYRLCLRSHRRFPRCFQISCSLRTMPVRPPVRRSFPQPVRHTEKAVNAEIARHRTFFDDISTLITSDFFHITAIVRHKSFCAGFVKGNFKHSIIAHFLGFHCAEHNLRH